MNVFLGKPPAGIEAWIKNHQPTPPSDELFCFTAQQDGSSVSLICQDDDMQEQIDIFVSLQYSTDENNWQEWDGHIISLNNGEKVYVKALNPNIDGMSRGSQFHMFIMKGQIAASGNIQYLIDPTGKRTDVPTDCYSHLFKNCTSLTQAPALPATTLADSCYYQMFSNCTSLTQTPDLPVTTLASYCYNGMFRNCKSLTQAHALPATTLASYCYYGMFYNCTSLTQAPALLATTLADKCYSNMFYKCNLFTEVHMKAEMEGVYNPSIHGDTTKTVVYDL